MVEQIQVVFGIEAILGLSYIVLEGEANGQIWIYI